MSRETHLSRSLAKTYSHTLWFYNKLPMSYLIVEYERLTTGNWVTSTFLTPTYNTSMRICRQAHALLLGAPHDS